MRIVKLLLALSAAAVCSFAQAGVDASQMRLGAGAFSSVAATTVTFDDTLPQGIHYDGGRIVYGTAWNSEYTSPTFDSGAYLAVGDASPTSTVTFGSGRGASYFGFYLGTPDSYNSVTFNGSDGSSVTFDGALLSAYSASTTGGAYYLGVFSTAGTNFTSIVFQSNGNSMETDNHAFVLAPVPEPETYAMLLGGLGLIGFTARRRRARLAQRPA